MWVDATNMPSLARLRVLTHHPAVEIRDLSTFRVVMLALCGTKTPLTYGLTEEGVAARAATGVPAT